MDEIIDKVNNLSFDQKNKIDISSVILHNIKTHVERHRNLRIPDEPLKINLSQIFHWSINDNTNPPIIACREVLYYLYKLGKNNHIFIDNIMFHIDEESHILCIQELVLQSMRKNLSVRNMKELTKYSNDVYKRIYNKESSEGNILFKIPFNLSKSYNDHLDIKLKMMEKKFFTLDYIDIAKTIEQSFNYENDTYILTDSEWKFADKIMKAMKFQNTINKSRTKLFSTKSKEDIMLQGIISEIAMCRILKIPVQNHHVFSRNVRNDTFDGTLPNGLKLDCKSITKKDGDLIVTENKRVNPADIYPLIYVFDNSSKDSEINPSQFTQPAAKILGYATKKMVFSKKLIYNSVSNQYLYVLKQRELLSKNELLDIINE